MGHGRLPYARGKFGRKRKTWTWHIARRYSVFRILSSLLLVSLVSLLLLLLVIALPSREYSYSALHLLGTCFTLAPSDLCRYRMRLKMGAAQWWVRGRSRSQRWRRTKHHPSGVDASQSQASRSRIVVKSPNRGQRQQHPCPGGISPCTLSWPIHAQAENGPSLSAP